jgi:hypothetical protein
MQNSYGKGLAIRSAPSLALIPRGTVKVLDFGLAKVSHRQESAVNTAGPTAKLREIKQQLRERMHDPVRQTGQWLKSIMQGHFNYYAVPGNLDNNHRCRAPGTQVRAPGEDQRSKKPSSCRRAPGHDK